MREYSDRQAASNYSQFSSRLLEEKTYGRFAIVKYQRDTGEADLYRFESAEMLESKLRQIEGRYDAYDEKLEIVLLASKSDVELEKTHQRYLGGAPGT